jgi:hypothetical protein
MDLTGSEWLIVILLTIGVVVLVVGLLGRIRWGIVLVGALLTAIAVFLLIRAVTVEQEPSPSPSPTPTALPTVEPSPSGPSASPAS